MSTLTGLLYGALIAYLGGWFFGYWIGNFALLLFLLTVVTAAYWLGERFAFKPSREAAAARLEAQHVARRTELSRQGIARVDDNVAEAKDRLLMQPWWLDWTAGLFPVILIVFLLRSFLFEPFKIPSGSMIPTLLVGDLILVNKFDYGIRLPVINHKIIANKNPARGDVVVFRYPPDPRLDYINRVVIIDPEGILKGSNRNERRKNTAMITGNSPAVQSSHQGCCNNWVLAFVTSVSTCLIPIWFRLVRRDAASVSSANAARSRCGRK